MKPSVDDPIVNLDQGLARGRESRNYKNGIFYSFYGLPYAKTPIGELRFKAPQPPNRWVGTLDATTEKDGSIAKNIFTQQIEGSEDCLYLNIYTPELNTSRSSTLRPVIVHVHGGGFAFGNNKTELHGPDFLLTQDIVLVTVCYRLGVFGFSSLEDPSLGLPGNHGIRDVIMALKWVQKNITSFCGDPDNVTLMGHSAGAAMIHYIMLSPLSSGLFHKIILLSGCGLCFWSSGEKSSLKKLTKEMGFKSEVDAEILEFLSSQPAEKIHHAQRRICKKLLCANQNMDFFPIIEEGANVVSPVISEDPKSIILKGNYNKVPMLLGYTTGEDLFFLQEVKKIMKDDGTIGINMEDWVPYSFNLQRGSEKSLKIAQYIRNFYFDGKDSPGEEYISKYTQLQKDIFYTHSVQTTIKTHFQSMSPSIFFYNFDLDGRLNMYKKMRNVKLPGPIHGDDLAYLFKMCVHPKIEENSSEDLYIQRIVGLYTNFAKFGNPNPEKLDNVINAKWDPVDVNNMNCFLIGKDLRMIEKPDKEALKFWEEIYKEFDPNVCTK